MISWPDIWIAVLGGVLIAAAVSVVVGAARPLLRGSLRKVSPGARSAILFLTAMSPLLAGIIGVKLIAWSPHALPFDLITHHCHADVPACASHARAGESGLLTALGAGVLGTLIVWLGLSIFDLIRQSNRSVQLLRAASDTRRKGTACLNTKSIVAVSAGLIRPQIFVSNGLADGLDDDALDIVLAHEKAHSARRDSLSRLFMSVLSVGHFPHVRARLLSELELAQEQLCDCAAAKRYGAIATAETLLKVERLKQTYGTQSPALCAAFGQSDIEARTRALISPDFRLTRPAVTSFAILTLISALTLLVAAEPVHHEIESLFLSLQN